ncbi:hypothetical protein IEQ34_021864 [Dendrobium chrysotoxum]|uniref:Uncharacterized protein n=1 Tax=Dendrobium chrysotoxum TaxID=161865 RepID=A0AAV7FJX5_DENCH|nr:hypothetical protein IEQ34_021864 [Dendrobium chrysotoxum]
MIKEFDLKMWVCVSDNFNEKKTSLQIYWPKIVVGSKKFLLILDDIRKEENHNFVYNSNGLVDPHNSNHINNRRSRSLIPTKHVKQRLCLKMDKEFVMRWLRMLSNKEHQTLVNRTNLYKKISIYSGSRWYRKGNSLATRYED